MIYRMEMEFYTRFKLKEYTKENSKTGKSMGEELYTTTIILIM
jgi:hypothetical protein